MTKEQKAEYQRKWRQKNLAKVKENQKAWYQANKERVRHQNWFKNFGITAERYREMLVLQGNACKICKSKDPVKGDYFAVDHDHATGRVRALLCANCNVGLGHFRDDPTLLQAALDYLNSPPNPESESQQGT